MIENRLKEWRQKRGLTLQQLAERAGTTRSQINKLENGSRRLTAEWMVRLAKPLACDPRELLALGEAPLAAGAPLPVYAFQRKKTSGPWTFCRESLDRIPCPPFLLHAKDAYGFYVVGDEMKPMFRPRQLLYAAPHRPPVAEGGAVVLEKDGTAFLAAFVGEKGATLLFRHYHPTPRNFAIRKEAITEIHAVVGTMEPA